MLVFELRFGLDDDARDTVLPGLRHAAEIGLVADFIIDVVEVLQGLDDASHHGLLHGQQVLVPQRIDLGPPDLADAIHVIGGIHRAQLPHPVLVEGAEQDHLDDNPPSARLRDEIGQPPEILRVPFRQVELVAAVGVAGGVAPGPRADQVTRCRCEGIVLNSESADRLTIGAAEGSCQVQSVCMQRGQIASVVECPVQHGPIMLAGGDQNHRLAPPEEVMRVLGVQSDWDELGRRQGRRPGQRHGRQYDEQMPYRAYEHGRIGSAA